MRLVLALLLFAGTLAAQLHPFPGPGRRAQAGGGGGSCSDNFDRADSDSLGANWTEAAGDSDIFTNTWRQSTGSYGRVFAIWAGSCTTTVTQYVKATFTNNSGEFPGLIVRYQNSSSPFYVFYMDQNAVWGWNTYASVAGASAEIATADSGTFAFGDSFGLTITGTGTSTVVRIWKNPVANTPVSAAEWDSGDTTPDASFTTDPPTEANVGTITGLAGASSSADNVRMDNFFSGDTN